MSHSLNVVMILKYSNKNNNSKIDCTSWNSWSISFKYHIIAPLNEISLLHFPQIKKIQCTTNIHHGLKEKEQLRTFTI